MRIAVLILVILFAGCSQHNVGTEQTKYKVISSFNEIMLETDKKEEAYEAAHNLTLMGRVFQSKPVYFVLENK